MKHRVVFLDRNSVKANMRRPACVESYVEYDITEPADVVHRLREAIVAIANQTERLSGTIQSVRFKDNVHSIHHGVMSHV